MIACAVVSLRTISALREVNLAIACFRLESTFRFQCRARGSRRSVGLRRSEGPIPLTPGENEVCGETHADRTERVCHEFPSARLQCRSHEYTQPSDQCEYCGQWIEPHSKRSSGL